MERADSFIAVFDSGVGGISVLRQLMRLLPEERFLYFGDSANAPYGVRTTQAVRDLTLAAADRLAARGIKAFVIACNTATAAALDAVKTRYPELTVIGTAPAVQLAAQRFPGGCIGVMATPVTLNSPRVLEQVRQFRDSCTIHLLPAPGLAELVEADKQNGPAGEALLRPLLEPLAGKLDALVLGCTHYPFAAPMINKILGQRTVFLDGSTLTAQQTKQQLEAAGLLRSGEGQLIIENSLPGEGMIRLCRKLLEG